MITDLSQVQGLTVIERVRLQALLDEMALGQSGVVDALSAPRLGKLLGAGKMVRGSYNVLGKNQLRLDVAFWDVLQRQFPQATTQTDVLDNLFKLEKDMVIRLLAEMGIEPTPQERERIQRVPTKNLQAFLAYCMGLQEEDAGNFEAAARYYRQAARLDPGFQPAGQKAEEMGALESAAGSKENLAASLGGPKSTPSTGIDLVNNRLQNLNGSLGSTFVPGQDSREPAQEAGQSSGGAIIGGGALPEPPQPPGGR
ncbi:MAG: hypothetical protein Kow0037_28450 [Calditrichia bacterium]